MSEERVCKCVPNVNIPKGEDAIHTLRAICDHGMSDVLPIPAYQIAHLVMKVVDAWVGETESRHVHTFVVDYQEDTEFWLFYQEDEFGVSQEPVISWNRCPDVEEVLTRGEDGTPDSLSMEFHSEFPVSEWAILMLTRDAGTVVNLN